MRVLLPKQQNNYGCAEHSCRTSSEALDMVLIRNRPKPCWSHLINRWKNINCAYYNRWWNSCQGKLFLPHSSSFFIASIIVKIVFFCLEERIRNRRMVDRSQLVICYIEQNKGGAYTAVQYAREIGCTVINIVDELL